MENDDITGIRTLQQQYEEMEKEFYNSLNKKQKAAYQKLKRFELRKKRFILFD